MPSLLTGSSTSPPMDSNGEEEQRKILNRNSTTEFSPYKTPFVSNNVLIIVLLTMAIMFVIALCAFCYSCFLRRKILSKRKNAGDEPNAPSRQRLEEAFEFQRKAMIEPHNEPKGLSDSASFRASLCRWASIKNFPTLHSSEQSALKKGEKHPSNYATTPRSVFPALTQKWSESSAKRIEHLRTKLVARFPSSTSHSTSDISVFFSTSSRNSEWGECSQINFDEDKDDVLERNASKSKPKSGSFNGVPSIVIEFVK